MLYPLKRRQPVGLAGLLMLAIIFTLVASLIGCASVGIETDTFNKRMLAGYATVQTIAEGTTAAYQAGKLGEKDRSNVVATGRAALEGMELARTVHDQQCPATAPPTCKSPAADAKLTATLAVLTALQAYLATHGGK